MKIKQMLTDNLFLKLLSVGAAVIFWIVVVTISDAQSVERFNMEVDILNSEVITDNGMVFRVKEGTNMVRVTVRSRKSILRDLKPTDFVLTADMEKDLKYDSLVRINVECKNKNIDVDRDITLSRSNVEVSIEDSATEQFPIHVDYAGTPNTGLVVGRLEPEQTIIKITGPVSIIERIKKVEAIVDVTGLTTTSVKTCKLHLTDGDGRSIDTAYLNYIGKSDGIDVKVSMLKTKNVPLKFSFQGVPDSDYVVKEISWKPETVSIAGDEEVLAAISKLEIPEEAVDVGGIDQELQLVVNLTPYLPSGVILTDEDEASVLVIVNVEKVTKEN